MSSASTDARSDCEAPKCQANCVESRVSGLGSRATMLWCSSQEMVRLGCIAHEAIGVWNDDVGNQFMSRQKLWQPSQIHVVLTVPRRSASNSFLRSGLDEDLSVNTV